LSDSAELSAARRFPEMPFPSVPSLAEQRSPSGLNLRSFRRLVGKNRAPHFNAAIINYEL